MLLKAALQNLSRELSAVIDGMGIHNANFGMPVLVEQAALASERIFQGFSKVKINTEGAYAAAKAFLSGRPIDTWQKELIASAVTVSVRECGGKMVINSDRFPELLAFYDQELSKGELWTLTWHGLLFSYFNFEPKHDDSDSTRKGWNLLRAFLEKSWPVLDKQVGHQLVPEWVNVLRREPAILSAEPVQNYAEDFLNGSTEVTERLAKDLGIPAGSWFWHALVVAAVKFAALKNDDQFKQLLPKLLGFIEKRPAFRDEALEVILIRYQACKSVTPDERLRDFVCHPNVWKNPKLKAAGIATAWNRVPERVWKMVLSWVNERNLKDFFDVLAARNNADEGRLVFWSKYLKQITWTRLVFSSETMQLQRTNQGVRDLIAREEGAYAQMSGKIGVDAFMMQIGDYLIIEFSKTSNACYVYQSSNLPFEPYARFYNGGTPDLGAGFKYGCALRILHFHHWHEKAEMNLRELGIFPDDRDERESVRSNDLTYESKTKIRPLRNVATSYAAAKNGESLDIGFLRDLITQYPGAKINDRRNDGLGRLWVEDGLQRKSLADQLEDLGFKWSVKALAWYYSEN